MAENQVDIILRGKNETAAAIAQVKGDLAGMFASTQGDIDKLKGMSPPLDAAKASAAGVGGEMAGLDAIIPGIGSKLATAFSVAGVVMFAKEVAGAVWGLNQMREESAQIEARFIAFGGGAAKATAALHAMDAAIGGAMTRDEKMAAVARITSLELTKSAQGTAELARQALLLGDASASAESKIDGLTQILVTGRTMGLAQYGISAAAVNERVKELQAETATLSDLEAKQIAIMEALATKTDAVAAAGGKAATGTRELSNAWEDLKDTIADTINLDAGINAVTQAVRGLTANLVTAATTPPELIEMRTRLAELGGQMTDISNVALWPQMGAEADALIGKIKSLEAAIASGAYAAQDPPQIYVNWLAATRKEAEQTSPELDAVSAALAGLRKGKDATDVNTVAMALFKGEITQAQVAALGLAGALALVTGSGAVGNQGAYWGGITGSTPPVTAESLAAYGKSADAVLAEVIRRAGETGSAMIKAGQEAGQANERAAKATQAAWDKAFDAIAGSAKSAFDKSKSHLLDLLPDLKTGADWATDPNGPFRDVGRAADVAVHGTASPFAAQIAGQLKTDMDHVKGEAEKYVAEYAQNPASAGSLRLVDIPSLTEHIVSDANAKADMEALGDKLATLAAASPKLKAGGAAITAAVTAGMGGGTGKKDSTGVQATSYDAGAKAMLDGFAASAQTQVKDETFGKDMAKVGRQTFGLFETGALEAAKESAAMRAWIYAMVLAAAAQQNAGRAAGMNDR